MNEAQKLKFYQKGTLTVGNRLIDEAERNVQASRARSNAITCRLSSRTCASLSSSFACAQAGRC